MADELRLREAGLEWRRVEDEVVALDVGTGEYLATNATGAALWPALAEGTDRAALVARLVERFGIDEERAAADVDAFVTALRERGLLAD